MALPGAVWMIGRMLGGMVWLVSAPGQRKVTGPGRPDETFSVTIVLRRRPDAGAVPDFRQFVITPLSRRRGLSPMDFG